MEQTNKSKLSQPTGERRFFEAIPVGQELPQKPIRPKGGQQVNHNRIEWGIEKVVLFNVGAGWGDLPTVCGFHYQAKKWYYKWDCRSGIVDEAKCPDVTEHVTHWLKEIPLPTQSTKSGEQESKFPMWRQAIESSAYIHGYEYDELKNHCIEKYPHTGNLVSILESTIKNLLEHKCSPADGLNKEKIIKWIDNRAVELNSIISDKETQEGLRGECRCFLEEVLSLKEFVLSLPSPPPAQREEGEAEPYFGWCDVDGCEREGCSGGMAWRDTGYWTVCDKHSQMYRDGKEQPKMKQTAIDKEKTRRPDGTLP